MPAAAQVFCELCGGCGCGRRRRRRGGGERQGGEDVQAGAAEELADDGLGEAGGVVLDADGFGSFVELEAANAVDLTQFGDGVGGSLGGWCGVVVEDVELGHRWNDSSGIGGFGGGDG